MTSSPSPALAWWHRALATSAPAATWVLRLVVGGILVSEGIQKFLFPAELGAGRFTRIGLPAPGLLAPFVALVEIAGGAALVAGLATRLVAVPLLVSMLVAITSTKLVTLGANGLWKTAHEARTDLLMIASLLYLLVVGAGPRSLDARLRREAGREDDARAAP